jgi:polar amino acid transport system substrate-binding protein
MRSEMVMLVRAMRRGSPMPRAFAANADLLMARSPAPRPSMSAVYDVLDGNEANPRIKLFETFGAGVEACGRAMWIWC